MVLEKTLESPLDCKEIQPVHPKGNQSWTFIGWTDAEAETPIFWPPDMKNWLTRKDPDAGKDWRWEEKGTTEDEMVGWHHWLDVHEFEQVLGVGDGRRPWCVAVHEVAELDTTEQLNWTEFQTCVSPFRPMRGLKVSENPRAYVALCLTNEMHTFVESVSPPVFLVLWVVFSLFP